MRMRMCEFVCVPKAACTNDDCVYAFVYASKHLAKLLLYAYTRIYMHKQTTPPPLACALAHTLTHTHTHTHTHFFCLSLSLTHTRTHTQTDRHTHTHVAYTHCVDAKVHTRVCVHGTQDTSAHACSQIPWVSSGILAFRAVYHQDPVHSSSSLPSTSFSAFSRNASSTASRRSASRPSIEALCLSPTPPPRNAYRE